MIKQLRLKNVKTHEDTVLEFSPGVNVVTGDSGHGKTNIMLALDLVADNRPLGIGWIRRGQDNGSVVVEVEEHGELYGIVRSRGKSKNIYDIEKNGKSILTEPFTAFGNSPPKEVSEILNLSNINVQKQRDQHFLVYTSPGQVAIYIRSITKLDEIDQVVKLLSGKIHKERGEISHCQKEFKSTNDTLIILNRIDLELLESNILEVKDRVLKNEQIIDKISRIEVIVYALKILEEHRIVIPDNIDKVFEDVDSEQKLRVDTSLRLSKLKILVGKIKKIEAGKIVFPEDLTILSTVERVSEEAVDTANRLHKLCALHKELRDVMLKITAYSSQITRLEDEERLLKEQLSTCPSCGTGLTEESKAVLLER